MLAKCLFALGMRCDYSFEKTPEEASGFDLMGPMESNQLVADSCGSRYNFSVLFTFYLEFHKLASNLS